MPEKIKHGGFNVITYGATGRDYVIRRVTLQCAIKLAEDHSRIDSGNYASVRRLHDGACVGLALRGEFRFDAAA